jgi:uncharacterized protein with ATP-grasp and redox domains
MRVHLDCFPCFLRQALIALRLGTKDPDLQERILKDTLADIRRADTRKPPAITTTFIHRTIRERLGEDPFKTIKRRYNRLALELLPPLSDLVEKGEDPLRTASRLSIAGNVIDFGIFTSIDIEGTIARSLDGPMAVDHYDMFREAVSAAENILFLADNAGEIAFDRLLIEVLVSRGREVTAVVKGSPVINDATREDAGDTGLTEICAVIDNGSDAVGTVLEWTSPELQSRFRKADLIISKGQANFETLAGQDAPVFFLFQAKCDVVAKELGLPRGAMLLKQHKRKT